MNSIYRVLPITIITEADIGPCQTSKMEFFPKTVNGFKPLTIFEKSYILDV